MHWQDALKSALKILMILKLRFFIMKTIFYLRYIAYAFCKCCISHMQYLTLQNAYAIYRIRDTFSRTLALCLGLGYSERTINNAYAFLICTSEVHFWFPKWHQKVEPTSCERPHRSPSTPNNIQCKLHLFDYH